MNCLSWLKRLRGSSIAAEDRNGSKSTDEIPLTKKEKFILCQNWKGIERDVTTAGANMFVRLFENNQNLYGLFDTLPAELKGTSKETYMENERIQKHGEGIMRALGRAITAIDDDDTFFAVLKAFGTEHGPRKGFRPEYFWKMEEPFLYAVKITLEHSYTENMERIYTVVIKLMLQKLVDACTQEQQRLGTTIAVDV